MLETSRKNSEADVATKPTTASASAKWVFQRYEAVRSRLPVAGFPDTPMHCRSVGDLVDRFDVFLFDSFGVLNVGETPIPGARECLQALRQANKRVAILTNAATGPLSGLVGKYAKLGFEFSQNEIISSREIMSIGIKRYHPPITWGVAAPEISQIEELGIDALTLSMENGSFDRAGGFILLSTQAWTDELQRRLQDALSERRRPVLVGNPDLAAPRETSFSLEPGTYAHAIADSCDINPEFYGKPFRSAFDVAIDRFGNDVPRQRIAMVGDTLHTDILGGAAAGLATVLVTNYGMLKDLNLQRCLDASGIIPDFIVPHI